MPSDYRYDPFNNIAEPVPITGETHIIPSNSPYTIRLKEVPVKDSPSTVSLTIAGVSAVEVAADPAAGEFRCDYTTGADQDDNWNTGLIQFNAADAGKTVVVSYTGIGSLVSVDSHGSQLFTTNGTFTVPKGVDKVYITGCGGGGSGSGNDGYSDYSPGAGGGGACAFKTPLTVTSGAQYTITVGAGGAQKTGGANGNAGGTSSFGALLSLAGGGGGLYDKNAGGAAGGNYASSGGTTLGGSGIFGVGGNNVYGNGIGSGFGSGSCCVAGVGLAGKQGFILVEW